MRVTVSWLAYSQDAFFATRPAALHFLAGDGERHTEGVAEPLGFGVAGDGWDV